MIIIPTYNERKNIQPLVGRIRVVHSELPILFVDDNSADGTADEIKSLQQTDKNIHLLSRPGKMGFASAYLDGFKFALKNFEPKFVITMDADLSHPPEKLPELIAIVENGKVGIGSRYVENGKIENWKLRRKILSLFGNLYARTLTKLSIRDLTSGFLAVPEEKLKQLNLGNIRSRGYAFLMELKFNLAKVSELTEVPITFVERREGESKLGSNIIAEGIKYPAKIFIQRQIQQNYLAWLIFFISLAVYVFTLPHTIFFGDSAEFMASGITLGIPHPPGYPTYTLIAKFFTYLPFGSVEFRVGLFSALCASLTLVVFYFLFLKIKFIKWIAVVASLILGFSNIFWSQAIMAKVYMPLLLIIFLILLLFAKFWETKKSSYLVASMFLFGLGMGFHEIILLFLPLLVFVFLVYASKIPNPLKYRFNVQPFFLGIFLILLALGLYLYLPIRASMHGNFYDFSKIFYTSRPVSFSGFKDYVLRTDYGDYGGQFIWQDKLNYINSFLIQLWQQFYWLLVLLPMGLIALWFYSKKFFILTLGVFLLNVLGIILLRSAHWNYENEFLYSFYYLPAYAMAEIWIGLGFAAIWRFLYGSEPSRPQGEISVLTPRLLANRSKWFVYLVLLLIPLWFLCKNFKHNNLSHFNFVDDYTKAVLQSLPPNAVLLVNFTGGNTDTILFGLHYQQIVKRLRQDVSILSVSDIYPNVDRKAITLVYGLTDPKLARYYLITYTLKTDEFKNRPIYTTYLVDNLSNKVKWTETSNGLVYKFNAQDKPDSAIDYHSLDYQKDLRILQSDLYGQDLISQYFYTQAAYWASQKDLAKAQNNFINGIKYDYKTMGIDQQDYIYYRNKVFGKL